VPGSGSKAEADSALSVCVPFVVILLNSKPIVLTYAISPCSVFRQNDVAAPDCLSPRGVTEAEQAAALRYRLARVKGVLDRGPVEAFDSHIEQMFAYLSAISLAR
jgi:hypothetical protein